MPRQRHKTGRKPLLDGPKRETLLTAIRAGNRISVAARYAGVAVRSVEEWIRRGEGRDDRPAIEPYISFAKDVDQAKAHAEVYAITQIRSNMRTDPRSAIWWLENSHPDWRRRLEAETTTVQVHQQPQNFILIDGDQLRRLSAERIEAERGDVELDDAARSRRAKLVSDSAQT